MSKTKFCKYCQTQVPKKTKVCPHCNRRIKKSHFILIFIILLFGGSLAFGLTRLPQTVSTGITAVNQFAREYKIEKETAQSIAKAISDCGLKKVTSIELNSYLDNFHFEGEKGFNMTANGLDNLYLYLNADYSVSSIALDDTVIYENNTVVDDIYNYVFTTKEQTKYQLGCENIVSQTLKAPSTAKFPSITEYAFNKENGIITVQSYVDAQNSFGAMIRSNFWIKFDSANNDNVISLIIDDKEYITQE